MMVNRKEVAVLKKKPKHRSHKEVKLASNEAPAKV
jgi:hypothetical protein